MSRINHVIGILHVQFGAQLKNGLSKYNTIRISSAYSTKPNADECHSDGPYKILQDKIQAGELKADEHQNNVMAELQQLYDTIQTYAPIELKPKSSLLKWLPIKSSKSSLNVAPIGIYIYGSVGGGKTTLMDLFYNSCQSVSVFSSNVGTMWMKVFLLKKKRKIDIDIDIDIVFVLFHMCM